MVILELDFCVEMGILGGRFMILEGLLEGIKEQLSDFNLFFKGDSSDKERVSKIEIFCQEV